MVASEIDGGPLEDVAGLHVQDVDDLAIRVVVAHANGDIWAIDGSDEVRMAEQEVPGGADGAEAADGFDGKAQHDVVEQVQRQEAVVSGGVDRTTRSGAGSPD